MRSDRVLRQPTPALDGRPPKHSAEFVFGRPDTWGDPDAASITDTRLYGTARPSPGTGSILS